MWDVWKDAGGSDEVYTTIISGGRVCNQDGPYSSRRRSMKSGLNLSPVMYSEDVLEESSTEDVSAHTQTVLVGESWYDACWKILDKILSEEDKVLEAASR